MKGSQEAAQVPELRSRPQEELSLLLGCDCMVLTVAIKAAVASSSKKEAIYLSIGIPVLIF